ncbi:MAG: arginyltransferase [Gammaproteobacteria bacterium]
MTEPPTLPRLGFFTSPPHECGYLPERTAVTMFADPRIRLSSETYSWLSAHGFRRSGTHVYRPHCGSCKACIAVRVAVDAFRVRRRHRRTLAINADLTVRERPARFDAEHFALYERYLGARHPDSQMDATNPGAYMSFLTAPWCDTRFYEFRLGTELLAVAVVDRLEDGLSSVYTFYSPDHPQRSLGRYAILRQIEWARAAGLPWVYLGYWIAECRKMRYKAEFAPLERYHDGAWVRDPDPAGGGR